MYDYKDILAALQSGDEADEIAKQFTDALNQAVKAKAEQEAKDAKAVQKKEDMKAILASLCDFIEKYYPEIYDAEMREALSADLAIKAFDEAYAETMKMQSALSDLEKIFGKLPEVKKVEKKKIGGGADDPIAAFLKRNGL